MTGVKFKWRLQSDQSSGIHLYILLLIIINVVVQITLQLIHRMKQTTPTKQSNTTDAHYCDSAVTWIWSCLLWPVMRIICNQLQSSPTSKLMDVKQKKGKTNLGIILFRWGVFAAIFRIPMCTVWFSDKIGIIVLHMERSSPFICTPSHA